MKPESGHQDCCNNAPEGNGSHSHADDDGHGHGSNDSGWRSHWQLLLSFLILVAMLVLDYGFSAVFPQSYNLVIYGIAWLLAGWDVLKLAFIKLKRLDIFNEFFLMSAATIGAFAIGEYSEGVAVMVFYSIGEWFQDLAVSRAKSNIKALLDIRPDQVTVMRNGILEVLHPSAVSVNETIQVKPGEKVALDGNLTSASASFNTAALTGESRPDTKYKGDTVLAGMINLDKLTEIQVTSLYKNSKLSKILELVQDATARKSQTQLFISKFAKIYTPIVFLLALAVCFLPYFLVQEYDFGDWFYRSLVFLVISCPCALVVSIPLGYFGGIGLASRQGILFKGGNFLDAVTKVDMVVMDKTGTLTKGVFKVREVVAGNIIHSNEMLRLAAILEKHSTHPVAKAIVSYVGDTGDTVAASVEEITGMGMKGLINGREVLAGNCRLLKKFGISYPAEIESIAESIVAVSIAEAYAGYITIADEIKEDAAGTIRQLHALGIKTVMLSGDKQSIVDHVSGQLGVGSAFGDLLPEGKMERLQHLKNQGYRIAFVGDGVNDAPVVALADVGIAMGGLGSDATIETADVVIQDDQPSKIALAIRIGKITRNVVWQNIILAMVVKIAVLALGAGGIATLWEAVIADVGVAMLAILNAVRIQSVSTDKQVPTQ